MKFRLIVILFCFLLLPLKAQTDAGYLQLARYEDQLKTMFDKLYAEEIPGTSVQLFKQIDSLFFQALSVEGSFDYSWSKLNMIGKLKSDDGMVNVFSWLYQESRDQYQYAAFVQLREKRGTTETFRLKPGDNPDIKKEKYPQKLNDWHGKIYYELITSQYKRKTLYTLLGADFNNSTSSFKTIEVLAIQRGKPEFRNNQFMNGGSVKNRIVLEYSADLSMSLRYNKELDMIVFDHLAPLHQIYEGFYQFYGPDGSYDGYRFTEGIWIYESDVDARNK